MVKLQQTEDSWQ